MQELHLGCVFYEPDECNLIMVCKFYANWILDTRTHFVTILGRNVPITPSINDILGKTNDTNPLMLTQFNIQPPYQDTHDLLCGPQCMAKWTKNCQKRYHKTLPYAHML